MTRSTAIVLAVIVLAVLLMLSAANERATPPLRQSAVYRPQPTEAACEINTVYDAAGDVVGLVCVPLE